MNKTIKINILVFCVLVLFVEIIFISLNYIFDGVAIYKQLNISNVQGISYAQKEYKKKKRKTLDDYYIREFDGYTKETYLKKYIKDNNVDPKNIEFIKGEDINFPIYVDKNNCRENKNENYIFSDTVLIGDSSLFGIAVASPHDIVGRLRLLNPNKRILNLGIPGTDPRQQVNHIKKVTKETNFDNIIWLFVEANDYEVNSIVEGNCGYTNLEPKTINRKFNVDEVSFLLSFKIFLAEHLRGLASFAKLFINYDDKFNLDKDLYENVVKDLDVYLNEKGVKNKYLYYLPTYNRHSYKNDFIIHPNVKKLNVLKNDVEKIVTKYGFKFIDGDEAIKDIKNKKELYHYKYPTHYNAVGYTKTADHMNEFIKDH
jgi:hypothetical protein